MFGMQMIIKKVLTWVRLIPLKAWCIDLDAEEALVFFFF